MRDGHEQRAATGGAVATRVERAAERVVIVRSARRRRSSSAGVRDGRVIIRVPASLPPWREREAVHALVERLLERADSALPSTVLPPVVPARPTRRGSGPRGDLLLAGRADAVAARHLGDVRAARVTWSSRMQTRWASCTMPAGHIRVSDRLADAPDEVLDNTLLHELCHLLVPGHGADFRALLARDPWGAEVERWLARRSRAELRAALGLSST